MIFCSFLKLRSLTLSFSRAFHVGQEERNPSSNFQALLCQERLKILVLQGKCRKQEQNPALLYKLHLIWFRFCFVSPQGFEVGGKNQWEPKPIDWVKPKHPQIGRNSG